MRRIALPALIAVTAFGLMAPWSLRNSLLIGRPCFVGDNLGHNLIQGNNEVADGRWTPPEWLPERLYGKMNNLPAPQWHEAMKQHALQFMTSNPAQELFYLIPAKLRLLFVENQVFWPWEDRQPKGHFATNPFGPRFYFPLLPFIPVLVLGVAGLFYRGRHLPHFIPLIWICSVLPFIVLVPNVRYRSPSDPLLIIMASAVFVRLVPRAQFRRITRLLVLGIFWWALAGMTLQWARFSGANLLKTKSLLRRGEAAQQMIRGVYTGHFTGISRDNMVSEPVGIIAVNPARVSDLLVSFDYSIKMLEPAERWMTINFTINYDDETSATVTMPATIDTVVPAQAALNSFQERGGTAWRIIHVPALTRFIRFDFTSNMCSDVKISNLAVHGPSWGNNPHLPGTIADKSPERGRQ
ncbi:MAG: hypothetical protein NTY46_01195 [Candidatus Sumerlaeota bacterium]|nr:hypothetical protein [Candidatus Sumerlaeota bacterium]